MATQNIQANEMLSTDEAAAVLGVKPQTLHLWRSQGRQPQPPYVRVGGRMVRYRRRALEAFIERQTVGATD